MNPVTRKRYTAEFKAQAVELVALGKSVPEVAEDLEVGAGILYGWVRKGAQPAQLGSAGLRVPQARISIKIRMDDFDAACSILLLHGSHIF
jgi:transposase-like protein